MISWVITGILALVVARIVWIEVKCGRKFKGTLVSTNEQIESIKQHVTETYRAKYGREPTGPYETVDISKTASAEKA